MLIALLNDIWQVSLVDLESKMRLAVRMLMLMVVMLMLNKKKKKKKRVSRNKFYFEKTIEMFLCECVCVHLLLNCWCPWVTSLVVAIGVVCSSALLTQVECGTCVQLIDGTGRCHPAKGSMC